MLKHTRWYWVNDGRFLVTGDAGGPHLNSRVVLELPAGATLAPEVRDAIAAMPLLYETLERITDEMQAWNSGGDDRSAAWPEARIKRARVALAAAGAMFRA